MYSERCRTRLPQARSHQRRRHPARVPRARRRCPRTSSLGGRLDSLRHAELVEVGVQAGAAVRAAADDARRLRGRSGDADGDGRAFSLAPLCADAGAAETGRSATSRRPRPPRTNPPRRLLNPSKSPSRRPSRSATSSRQRTRARRRPRRTSASTSRARRPRPSRARTPPARSHRSDPRSSSARGRFEAVCPGRGIGTSDPSCPGPCTWRWAPCPSL